MWQTHSPGRYTMAQQIRESPALGDWLPNGQASFVSGPFDVRSHEKAEMAVRIEWMRVDGEEKVRDW